VTIASPAFGEALCEVLGFGEGSSIKAIQLDVQAGEPPVVHVTKYLDHQTATDFLTLLSTYRLERKNDN
jgi:hypothetical protein